MKTGEIYWVNLDPTVGDEIKKKRPVIILNGGHNKHLKLAIVVPVTAWSRYWDENPYFVTLEPNSKNGLSKKSSVYCFQIRAISHNRFVKKIGNISNDETELIRRSITLILYIEPEHCE